jgi:hypothetical protein
MTARDRDLGPEGVTGDPNRVPEEGTARVESRITGGDYGAKRFEDEGGSTGSFGGEARARAGEMYDRAEDLYDDVRDRVDEYGDRAAELADRARREGRRALHEAEAKLEATGVMGVIREYPLLVAGLAFGAGFLLAGAARQKRRGVIGAATGQLRGALLAGLSATLTQELRNAVDEHGGVGNLVSNLTGRGGSRG